MRRVEVFELILNTVAACLWKIGALDPRAVADLLFPFDGIEYPMSSALEHLSYASTSV